MFFAFLGDFFLQGVLYLCSGGITSGTGGRGVIGVDTIGTGVINVRTTGSTNNALTSGFTRGQYQ